MNEKFIDAVDRAKLYVSKLASQKNNYSNSIDVNKIWQLNNAYIVSPVKSGIVIIDQKLAHQRILYEKAISCCKTHPQNFHCHRPYYFLLN